jgi:HD superfamily phosphohydrolase
MASSNSGRRVVNDNIHGDILLTDNEWKVVNTATFQRLRSLKQLGMGHLVYPNATHTRFAHSLGVFHIMSRVLDRIEDERLDDERDDLRMAALLHDIGHYPYSHLMERVDWVKLTEEEVEGGGSKSISSAVDEYPDHETLGRHIIVEQDDIREALGGKDRAEKIGALFSRLKAADQQLSKLIHSSLDMDRMDYLLRDTRAAGVPFGEIDINYLLNNIRVSPGGMLGVDAKALAAAEHFLFARAFMHRSVYYHKTTFGFEEACRQLLRRVRDDGNLSDILPPNGSRVLEICGGADFHTFIDNFVDRIVFEAVKSEDLIVQLLAKSIIERRPPSLLVEVSGITDRTDNYTPAKIFKQKCRENLSQLAVKYGVELGQFLLCGPKPITFEKRGSLLTKKDAQELEPEESEELIMVFARGEEEPQSIVDFEGSVIKTLSNQVFTIQRLYFVDHGMEPSDYQALKQDALSWAQPPN